MNHPVQRIPKFFGHSIYSSIHASKITDTLRGLGSRKAMSALEISSAKRKGGNSHPVSPPPTKRKLYSTTTKTAVATFFQPTSQKPPEKTSWRTVSNTMLVARYSPSENPPGEKILNDPRIAGFDLDSTLIKSVSGNKFGKDATDWKWWHLSVPGTIKQLSADGYHVIVFSNQGGLRAKSDSKGTSLDQKRLTDFKNKVNAVLSQLDVPISVYAATGRDQYRKPRTGMWEEMVKDYGLTSGMSSTINLAASVFVGDAAGRPGAVETKSTRDFATSDRDFAANIGVPFKTPEEYFLGDSEKPFTRLFDPVKILAKDPRDNQSFARLYPVEIVVFCGRPGAGKSTFYWTHLAKLGYERVNQDILKTRDRCLKVARDHLKVPQSIVVDATNADPETRAYWIRLGQEFDAPVRCVLFNTDAMLCEHNDAVRALSGHDMNPEGRSLLPRMAFTGYASRFRPPTLAEGFKDITTIDFVFSGTSEQKRIWSKFWI